MAAKRKNKKGADETPTPTVNELREPRWSVVTFERRAAKNLSYAQAEAKLGELARQKISGLCIITDEAAERVGKS